MQTIIFKRKMPKKAQREMNKQRRVVWGMNPITRVKLSAKIYRREKMRGISE